MLLKSLELQGFKTFPDRTKLVFHDGITSVVGPNGSGKSNLSDAVRWALGEQSVRALRCTKMEDVIFGGTPARGPLGFAEVTLNIDNSGRELPFDESSVSVTRRYYRSGESEYRINGNAVRLKDINELFMDTGLGRDGYSIIGQGRIDSIVAARSEDRREIFEEAAGVSRFRYRKEETEHRLAQAEENLLRLHDILSELESRVGPLREQSEKAKRYLELADEKKGLEIGLWLDTLSRSNVLLREQEDKIQIARNQYDAAEQAIAGLDGQLEKTFQGSNACAAKADEINRRSASLDEQAAQKDGEASVLQNDIKHNEENISRVEEEIRQAEQSGGELESEIAEKKKQIAEKQSYIAAKEKELEQCTAQIGALRGNISDSAGKIDGLAKAVSDLTAQATQAKMAEMTADSTISEIGLRLDSLQKSRQEKSDRGDALKKQLRDCEEKLQQADKELESLKNSAGGYEMLLQTRARRREEAKQQRDRLGLDLSEQLRKKKLLEDLERNLEGFTNSVKAVMKAKSAGALGGIHGPVSRLIHVPGAYAVAIETALGNAMQDVVTGDESDAKRAIAFLKQNNAGRATFLPLTVIRGRKIQEKGLPGCRGFVGIAAELCSCGDPYREAVDSLLGRVAVAEDLDSAVAIAGKYGYRFRIVTLDGQVVNAGGSLTGGSLARNSGLLSRASEIEKIGREAEELRGRSEKAEEAFRAAAREASAAEASLSAAKAELADAQGAHVRLEEEARRVRSELATAQEDCKAFEQGMAEASERLEAQKKTRGEARGQAEKLNADAERKKAELSALSASRNELDEQFNGLTEKIRQIEMEKLSTGKDVQSLEDSVREISGRSAGHRERIEGLKKQIDSFRASSDGLTSRIALLHKTAEELRSSAKSGLAEIETLNAKRMELEKRSLQLRTGEREKSEEKEKIGHDLALLEERKASLQKEYDGIIAQLWEEYQLTRREAEEQTGAKIEDPAKAKRRLASLKTEIRDLGSVNVASVEEYKEVSQRYEFLKEQIADSEQSRDELGKLIGSLTNEMRSLFSSQFEKIGRNFEETFRDLFDGGTAHLSLTTPDDVLNSGIEISVQPPGKIVTHLESLSGGEKSLVAIALYFAIMKVNPPPFCVLDEIDAALDDVNVTRFASYLRRMNRNTQFILVTHRRGSMEEADVLYGVTMQEEGVSKLLEMPVAQMEKQLGIRA